MKSPEETTRLITRLEDRKTFPVRRGSLEKRRPRVVPTALCISLRRGSRGKCCVLLQRSNGRTHGNSTKLLWKDLAGHYEKFLYHGGGLIPASQSGDRCHAPGNWIYEDGAKETMHVTVLQYPLAGTAW